MLGLRITNVLRAIRPIIKKAGLDPGAWTLCGHSGTTITESVYRHQLRPVLLSGAVAMDRIFSIEPGPKA